MVMMCRDWVVLISRTIAASVVLLPAPVGPVTMTRPFLKRTSRVRTGGSRSSSRLGMWLRITRKTAPIPRLWTNTLARKRPTPGSA